MNINGVSIYFFIICQLWSIEGKLKRDRQTLHPPPPPPPPSYHHPTAPSSLPPPRNHHQFTYIDCGSDEDRLVRFLDVAANPSPIRAPGKVKLSALFNVTRQLPLTLSADVIVSKYFYGIPLKIPCYRNMGTCHYKDVCSLLESMFPTNDRCPRVLKKHGIPCRCPFYAGLYHLKRLLFHLPDFTGMLEALATGEYDTRLRIYDYTTKSELACLQLKFNMKRQRKRGTTIITTTTTTTK